MSDNGFAEGLACGQGMNSGYGCGGGFGWGGDWIALIFLAAIFGGGGWGGGFGGGGANVFGEVQRGFDTTGINNKLNGLENGLCDGFYAQNTNLLNGFSGISREIAEGYTEDDLCMAANMLYSDYCEVLKPYISREPEKEADFYVKMAKAFLDDEDAPDGSAKLAMYYFCIADVDE